MRMSTGGRQPRFFIWENVPGAFTSGSERGADFRALLESIAETSIPMPKDGRWANAGMVQCPKCEIAWRVLDAQYWGVPQRRRRTLSQILQPKSDVPQKCYLSSRACQGILRRAARRGKKLPPSLETALKRQAGAENTINRHAVFSENEKTYSVQAIGHIVESEKSSTLAARDYKSSRNFVEYSKIDKQQEVPLYDISHRNDGVREIPKGACNTLAARRGTGGGNVAVLNEADRQKTDDAQTVRRLTVTECERLQGLPDGYTDVSVNGKPASERDRLMALGNGMAQPCADYVIQRIVDEVGKTYI